MSEKIVDDVQYLLPHDSANSLILPAAKKRRNTENDGEKNGPRNKRAAPSPKQKQLSKKKTKQLQKVLDKRKKRAVRQTVLEKLALHRISEAEREQCLSFARINQKEGKRNKEPSIPSNRNSIVGSRRGKIVSQMEKSASGNTGPYFETDSSSESDDSDQIDEGLKVEIDIDSSPTSTEIAKPVEGAESSNYKASEQSEACGSEKSLRPKSEKAKSSGLSSETTMAPPPSMPTIHVPVYRSKEVQTARLKLPILAEEQPVVEAIKENPSVIICGETGSGKTTQVPQFLYEAGFCVGGRLIGITEPRRVAAISMSKRVSEEMNLDSSVVSYQIRYEGNVTEKTLIKFMTDGVLLKEIQKDFLLSAYSAIIIDEAHERSMYSDILIGLLSRILPLREKRDDPLKLVIMSATLRVEDFTQKTLFRASIPPVLQVESRQFPVTVYFAKSTSENYLAAAYRKVSQIHKLAPPDGGILVFVSGQKEVLTLIRWLKRRFPIRKSTDVNVDEEEEIEAAKKQRKAAKKLRKKKKGRLTVKELPNLDLDSYTLQSSGPIVEEEGDQFGDEGLDLQELDALDLGLFEDEEELELEELELEGKISHNDPPLYCLPLYSLLPSEKQRLVFQAPPSGYRLCVVATNVAETSLTIPGIKYIVDTGKEKVRVYDGVVGASKFLVQWISKASANQRAGRAGRTCPGHCYRLYSSAVFNDFETFSRPEIVNKPVDELIMQMKSMNIIKVVNFPFPTPPDRETLEASEKRLLALGALAEMGNQVKITPLGRTISLFPVKPQFGKMLALGNQYGLLPYVVCLVSILSVREPMKIVEGVDMDDEEGTKANFLKMRRQWAVEKGNKGQLTLLGDVAVLLRAMIEFEKKECHWRQFCARFGFRLEAMTEAKKMRRQLTEIINKVSPGTDLALDDQLDPPNERQAQLLRQLLLSGLVENVAVKIDPSEVGNEEEKKKLKRAYQTSKMKDFVYVHPNSVLYKTQPRYVIYQELVETSKKYMHTVTAVEGSWMNNSI